MKRLLMILACSPLAAAQPALTPKALIEYPRVQDCQLSPDGKWLAVQQGQVDWKDNRVNVEVHLYRVGESQPAHVAKDVAGVRWAPDSSKFLFQRKGDLWVCSVDQWRQWKVTPGSGAIWSPDSSSIAYSAPLEGPKVEGKDTGRLYDDLFLRRWNHYYDGKVSQLYVSDLQGKSRRVSDRFLSDKGQPRDALATSATYGFGDGFCYSADGTALFFSAPPARGQAYQTNYDVYRLDLKSGAVSNLTPDNPAADLGPILDAARGKLYIVSHQRPGYESDFGQLRSCPVSPAGVPQGKWTVEPLGAGEGLGDVQVLDNGDLLYSRNLGARNKVFRRNLQGQVTPLELPGSVAHVSATSSQWSVIQSSLDTPPRVLWGSWNQPQWKALGSGQPWKLGKVESLQVAVEKASMQMWLIKPPNYTAEKRWPLVYMIHGGPQGGWNDSWSLRWNPQVWAAQGYLVAMPNPRGSSGQGTAFQEGVSRDWGGLAYRDLMKGVDELEARPDVDPKKIAAVGASYGGYMVNWISVNTGRFCALMTHCGLWNLESMYGTTDELWFTDWEFGGPPWGPNRPVDYDRFSPHSRAHELARHRTPHLVIHNDLDYRCPIDQGLQLFTALQRQGVESQFLNFPDEGHWVLKPANSLRWHTEVFRFLGRHLGG